MRTKQDKSLLKDFVACLNNKYETTVSEIARDLNWNSASLMQYVYVVERAGFVFRYGQHLVLREKIPPCSIDVLKGMEKDDPDLRKQRIDRLKETALTPEFLQSLTFIECLYLVAKFRTSTFTTNEFAVMTGKCQKSVATIFTKLVRLGYLQKDKLKYTIIQAIPVHIQQSDILSKEIEPKLDLAQKVEAKAVKLGRKYMTKQTKWDIARSAAANVDFLVGDEVEMYARAIYDALVWGESVNK